MCRYQCARICSLATYQRYVTSLGRHKNLLMASLPRMRRCWATGFLRLMRLDNGRSTPVTMYLNRLRQRQHQSSLKVEHTALVLQVSTSAVLLPRALMSTTIALRLAGCPTYITCCTDSTTEAFQIQEKPEKSRKKTPQARAAKSTKRSSSAETV